MNSAIDHAAIVRLDRSGRPVKTLKVMFNPKEYVWRKQNTWTTGTAPQANIPDFTFGSGQPATLQLQLHFDTYPEGKDVRSHTDELYDLMLVDPELVDSENTRGRPPTVRFQWGKVIGFDSVITDITQRFSLFLPDGTPVRAVLDVSFQEVRDPATRRKQNPTSGGAGGERVWTVKEGESLSFIAFKTYGDPTLWRLIADANRLAKVRELAPGTTLAIPNA